MSLALLGGITSFSLTASAQLAAAVKAASVPITSKDVRVLPFCGEFKERVFKANDQRVPDALRTTFTDNHIRIAGKKKDDRKATIDGAPAEHFGKLVLLSPTRGGKGTLSVKVAPLVNINNYLAALELPGDSLSVKPLKLDVGKTYQWELTNDSGTLTLSVSENGKVVGSVKAPADKVLGYGFAAGVHWKNSEADLTIEFQ